MRPVPSTKSRDASARSQALGRWLISMLAWGPLMCWLAWHPLAGTSGLVALILNWVYHGRFGVNHQKWPTLVGIAVAFNVSFAVAGQSAAVGTFAAVSVLAGGLVSSLAGGLIVVVAVRLARVGDYGLLEDRVLLAAPLIVAAKMAGITAGAIVRGWGSLVPGLLAGLAAGTILSIWVLAWVYGAVGIAAWWVERRERRDGTLVQVWQVVNPPSPPTPWQER